MCKHFLHKQPTHNVHNVMKVDNTSESITASERRQNIYSLLYEALLIALKMNIM